MNKREYIQANRDWLEAKSKEEGVKALPKGIYYMRSISARLLPKGRKKDAGIFGGDRVIIDRAVEPHNCSIVVAGLDYFYQIREQ